MFESKRPPRSYNALAAKITSGRSSLGLTQAELAAELGFKQQAVSRWEAGTHRPAVEQVPVLAALLREDLATLMQLAGYGSPVTASLSTQFPVDALDPATFEQFIADLVEALHPTAEVRLQGSRGHKQEGADVRVRFPDGRIWSFQCKRVERFGKAEVEKAIAYHSVQADRAFLVLSKIASPATVATVETHTGWTLWDKQDLTRKIRSLTIEAQERLVDTYFRGQRMALLGRSEPGPWLSIEEYFAPFRGRGAVFSHDWSLMGREREIAALIDAIDQDKMPVTLLVGSGGMGKTRALKEAVQRLAAKNKGTAIRFLSTSQEPNAASLEALGTGRKVLIVDDAHDREGLNLLIEHTINSRHNTNLLIATRPYAEQRIRNELALYGIVIPSAVRLEPLDRRSLHSLIGEVLKEFGGNLEWADAIIDVAADSPLVAAMAARVVAREGVTPELARGKPELRQVILSRFTRVITGHLGTPSDAALLRAVLELLAIIQPFHVDDRRVAELVEATRPGIVAADVSRALKMLVVGGVIYKRGQLYRLMPDLLGDFLIEESCIGADGTLTPFAQGVADAVEGGRLTQVLVNLGRMDWRRTEGNPSTSDLLDPIWRKLAAIEDPYDPRLEAVQAVAYYQPGQALNFVQAQIEQGRMLKEPSGILRRVALSLEHRRDALRLLWDLGKHDDRDLNPHPSHPIRVLGELIGYDRHKPLAFVEEVAEFGFELLDDPAAWSGRYTPLDVLAPLLRGEGMTTTSTGRAISMTPFFVEYDVVAPLRARFINRIIELLEAGDQRIGYRAALILSDAVRSPHGLLSSVAPDELLRQYNAEFTQTIARVGVLMARGSLAPTTVIGLIKSLSWYAEYDKGTIGDQVRSIFAALPYDLDLRFHATLAEGADYSFIGQVQYVDWDQDCDWLSSFVAELLTAYPDRAVLCTALVKRRAVLEAAGISTSPSNQLVGRLIAADPSVGREIIDRSYAEPETRLRDYLGIAVGARFDTRPDEGRAIIRQMLSSPDPIIRSSAARGLVGLRRLPSAADVELLGEALSSEDAAINAVAITALRTWRDLPGRETITLALAVRFDHSPSLFESVAMVLCSRQSAVLDQLREDDVCILLARMTALPLLEGHWTGELLTRLAKCHGILVAKLLIARVDLGISEAAQEDFRSIGYSHRRGHLNLQDSSAAGHILDLTWLWLRQHDGTVGWARYQIGQAFAALFKLDTPPVVEFFNAMLDRATAEDLRWIGDILRNAHHWFIFEYTDFVERYLNRCKAVEAKLVKEAVGQMVAAAMSGSWSGAPGEPMPRDVKARDKATAVLAKLSRLSPAYPLYRSVLEDSKRNIARSVAEGEAMDIED